MHQVAGTEAAGDCHHDDVIYRHQRMLKGCWSFSQIAAYMRACVHACLLVCLFECVFLWYVVMCMYVCMHADACARVCALFSMCLRMHIDVCLCVFVQQSVLIR